MCPQSEVYKKSVATSVLAGKVRVENACTVRTWDCGVAIIIIVIIIIIIIIIIIVIMKSCGFAFDVT